MLSELTRKIKEGDFEALKNAEELSLTAYAEYKNKEGRSVKDLLATN